MEFGLSHITNVLSAIRDRSRRRGGRGFEEAMQKRQDEGEGDAESGSTESATSPVLGSAGNESRAIAASPDGTGLKVDFLA